MRSRIWLQLLLPLGCLVLPGGTVAAHAEPDELPDGMVEHFDLCDKAAVIRVRFHSRAVSTIELSSLVLDAMMPESWPMEVVRFPHSIEFHPTAELIAESNSDTVGTFTVHTQDGSVSVDVVRAIGNGDWTRRAVVKLCSDADVLMTKVDEIVTISREFAVQAQQRTQAAMFETPEIIKTATRGYHEIDRWQQLARAAPAHDDESLRARVLKVSKSGGECAVLLEVANLTSAPLPLTRLTVLDDHRMAPTEQRVFLAEQQTPAPQDVITTLAGNTSAQLAVYIKNSACFVQSLGLQMSAQEEGAPRTVTERWFIPVDPEVPPPPENEGKLTINLQAIGGVIWLGDGLEQNKLEPTTLQGLSVRVSYGLHRLFSVETEIVGAGSGQASFNDMSYNNMDGTLHRSASLGRVQFAGVLRLGEKIIPTLRLGVGLQGAGYDAELMTETGPKAGPESGLEFTTTLNFGAGLDVRLGDHLAAGFAASVISRGTDPSSIEAGIHAGYAWKP